jgi:tRNA threonylcarbamoyladenosine biosynthesis protein TsaB
MRLLALDAATEACSVALICDGEWRERSVESGKAHATEILRMVQELLAEAEIPLSGLDGLAASVGPGSFTGVRISVAVAQGLAFGAGLSVVPVGTLEALALQAVNAGAQRAIACLDARMGEVYWGCFESHALQGVAALNVPGVGPPDAVRLPSGGGAYRGIGRGFSAYPILSQLPGLQIDAVGSRALPNAREMAQLGVLRLAAQGGLDPADLIPLYLRDKVALTSAERATRS